jgi:hypothetical protein
MIWPLVPSNAATTMLFRLTSSARSSRPALSSCPKPHEEVSRLRPSFLVQQLHSPQLHYLEAKTHRPTMGESSTCLTPSLHRRRPSPMTMSWPGPPHWVEWDLRAHQPRGVWPSTPPRAVDASGTGLFVLVPWLKIGRWQLLVLQLLVRLLLWDNPPASYVPVLGCSRRNLNCSKINSIRRC